VSELEAAVVTEPPLPTGKPPAPLTLASSKRRILRGSAWLLTGKVVTTILGLLINAFMARLLSPTDLGAFFTVFTLVVIGSTVAQLGLDRAVVRLVSASLGTGRLGQARQVIRTVFLVGGLASAALGLALALGLGQWLASHLYHSSLLAGLMPLAAGWLVATALQSLLVETFRGMQRFGPATIFDQLLVDILVATTVTSLWLVHARPSLKQILALFASVTAVTVLVSGLILVSRTRKMRGEGHADRSEILSIAWPLLITNVATYLLGTGVDLWILAAFRPPQVVAVYGAASRLMFFVVTPFLVMQGVVAPLAAELAAQGRKRDLETALRSVAMLAAIPAILALVVFLVFGSSVMGFFYGPFYRQGAMILFILSAGRLVVVWTGSCAIALMMTGHQRILMVITVAFGSLSVIVGIVLAWKFGAVGIAAATAGVAALQNVVTMTVARRRLGVWTNAYLSPGPLIAFFRERAPTP
jgi:O-antigen/teichoic acid export membrane protein